MQTNLSSKEPKPPKPAFIRNFLRVADQMKAEMQVKGSMLHPGDYTEVESEMSHEEDAKVRAALNLPPTPPTQKRTTRKFCLDGLTIGDWLKLADYLRR